MNWLTKKSKTEKVVGLTQSELAVKLGYRRDTIAKWEAGRSISKCALEDICTFFGIDIQERK